LAQEKAAIPAWSEDHLRLAVEAARVALWSWQVDHDDFAMDERGFDLWGLRPAFQPFQRGSRCTLGRCSVQSRARWDHRRGDIWMTYRHLRSRLQAIVDAAFEELDAHFGGDPETALERLPEPLNAEEHVPYVEYMFAAMGVRGVAASTGKVLRTLDHDRSAITEGSSAEKSYVRIVEFAERAVETEMVRFRLSIERYESVRRIRVGVERQ
jgi:hypothetical protein